MFKNKNKNSAKGGQYGTFITAKAGYKKYARLFVTALTVVIFVLGAGIALFKLKPVKKAAVSAVADQIPGWWNQQYFSSSTCDKDICLPAADPDKDNLTNVQEFYYHTNPLVAFTAGDTINDGQLVAAGYDPSKPGRVTFDQVANPENLLGESLVFASDVKQMVADANDIGKVNLPLVQDDQLQVVYGESEEVYKTYISRLQSVFTRYFRTQDINNITEILKSGNDTEVIDIKIKAAALAEDLKAIPVPGRFLTFHKYNIVEFQLLSEIIPAPADISGPGGDVWYEKVQAFLAVQQKLSFEEQVLKQGK